MPERMPRGQGGGDVAWQADEARRAFLSRLLSRLIEGPLSDDTCVCTAFLAVERTCTEDLEEAEGMGRARAAAKRLLAVRRESLPLWAAYAQLEAQAGNRKVRTHLHV